MNTEKFQGMAEEYSKYRPTYPDSLYRFLYEDLGFSEKSVIADIGAGTGIFSLPMLQKGSNVYCIEPNKDMKKKMDEKLGSLENYHGINTTAHGINTTAENTGLPDASVDFIVSAQAFHWFDRTLFKKECRRILKSEGLVALVWNIRDENDEFTRKHYLVNKEFCPDFNGFSGGINKADPDEFSDFFEENSCGYKLFENDLRYNSPDAFIGKCLTSSYAPKSSAKNYADYVEALRELYEQFEVKNGLEVKDNAVVYWGRV